MTLHIIGINHGFQGEYINTIEEYKSFNQALRRRIVEIVMAIKVSLLAEEYSEEVLRTCSSKATLLQEISDHYGVAHLFCDPENIERNAEGILDDESGMRKREGHWLHILEGKKAANGLVIFLCGYDHYKHFIELCVRRGHQVVSHEKISHIRGTTCWCTSGGCLSVYKVGQ